MGRIDEALRRAGAKPADEGTRESVSHGVFESPWTFHDEEHVRQIGPAQDRVGPATDLQRRTTRPPQDPLLPADPRLAVFKGFRKDMTDRLVVGGTISPYMAEQYRRLAATLHHAQLVQGIKVILVT